ncbi:MAG: hypothetical protein H0X30_05550 [Anaerolineae bacterium]|nr:hypothetical protein [Anaerolineae bacterium]
MLTPNEQLAAFLSTLPQADREAFIAAAIDRANIGHGQTDYTTPDGIVRFVRDVLLAEPAPYQEHILRELVIHKRVCVRGPHGLGKTALAAWVVLWGMYAFDTDVKIPTTASAWRQLTFYLWPEIRQWAKRAQLDKGMRILDLALKMPNKEAFAVASDDPALIEGAHASTLIYVFDESKSIPDGVFQAAEGAFSGAGTDTGNRAYALAISTPGEPSGVFHSIQTRRPGYEDWIAIHVTLEECIAAGRISREWADQRKKQWGENSAPYRNRVLGEFADSGEDSVIPLSWVEKANERWEKCSGMGSGSLSYGLDPARYGDDSTTTAKLVGRVLESLTYREQQSTMQTAGRMVALAPDKNTSIGVDVIGVGAGVYDRLHELGYKKAKAINASESAKDERGKPLTDASGTLEFYNKRSQLWWALREALDPESEDPLALPPDDRLTGDLTAPTYDYTSNGRIRVESKDDIRARIGRSTDAADALALALDAARPGRGGATMVRGKYSFDVMFGYERESRPFDRMKYFENLKKQGQKNN